MLNGGFESPDTVELKVIQQGPAAHAERHGAWSRAIGRLARRQA
jgi:hypothetical protein